MTQAHPIPAAALESDIAILGKKGRGKSFTARGIAERLLADGRRVVVLDPLSTWWGLAAGPEGFPIAVLGGPHGDLPLSDGDGAALGRYLATTSQSAVLDLGQMRKAETIRFASAFLEELYTANRDPLWLVLEEADVFAPQNPDGATARLYGEVDRIARRGRQFGFRLITLTQRPARLAKDVLTQLSTLIALGITSPQDREAIKAWVEGNADRGKAKEVVDSLASLAVGEGWVWVPDLDFLERVTFPPNRTPDTSATPKAGEARAAVEIGTRANVEGLRAALAAGEPEGGPVEPASTQRTKADAAAIQAAEARGYECGRQDGRREAVAAALAEVDAFRARLGAMSAGAPPQAAPQPAAAPLQAAPRAPARSTPQRKATAAAGDGADRLMAILRRHGPLPWPQAALLAGYVATGGGFLRARSAILAADLVVEADAGVAPREGAEAAPIDAQALLAIWSGKLADGASRLLSTLAAAGGAMTVSELAKATDYVATGGGFLRAMKSLRTSGLVQRSGQFVEWSPAMAALMARAVPPKDQPR